MIDIHQDATPTTLGSLLERSILDTGIPPCPAILYHFTAESNKDEPDYHHLAIIIGTDVSVSEALIKTANSPYFSARQRVRSANEALAILGLNTASRAIAGIILRKAFPHVQNLERFWDASARLARLSGWLTQYLNVPDLRADDAYTFGLFRDCGIPVLLGRFPHYKKTLETANHDAADSFTRMEEAEIPTNHAMVGCLLAQNWWLPEETCLAIRNHHDLAALESVGSALPMPSRRLIAVAQLSEHIVQQQLDMSFTQEWPKLGIACLRILDINEANLKSLYVAAAPIAGAAE